MKPSKFPELPPALTEIINSFIDLLRADKRFDAAAVDRLEELIRRESAPKPEDITRAVFGQEDEGRNDPD
jgi:hypothetical protein